MQNQKAITDTVIQGGTVNKMPNKLKTPPVVSEENTAGATVAQKKIPFAIAEAYKSIRTNLISLLDKENKKVFVISSPNASEGKSTTAINTAISLSQLNKKVLLVDVDAHRPSIHHKLKLDNSLGIMELIDGKTELDDTIKHYNSSLDVITTGALPQNATEMFSAPQFDELLKLFRENYDYVILDAPPVNILSDALVIGQKVDGMVFIIRAGITTHENLRRALSSAEVLDIDILGVILNGSDYGTKHYYKKYYSTYNGKYSY